MAVNKTGKKRIIAVGGGFASTKLALELGHEKDVEVMLMSPHNELEFHGALYRSATGRSPLEVALPFREIFAHTPNVTVVNDFLTELRPQVKQVKGQSGRTYDYDALVMGVGYEVEYFGIRGMREYAESIYTVFDAIKLRNRLRDTFIEKQGKRCSVAVVGAGATGIELSCDLNLMADLVAEQYKTTPVKLDVTVVDRADRVLPQLKPEVSAVAAERLEQLGVKTRLNTAVDHCTTKHLCITGGDPLIADIIVWSAGSRANSFFERYPDIFTLDERKRVVVNEFMQVNSPDIYVLGDSASTQFAGMAQTAINDAVQLADNFKRYLHGKAIQPYKPHPPVYVVPMGGEWAVAQQGDEIVVGTDAWKIRREADFFVLHSFLPKSLATKYWQEASNLAQI